MKLSLQDMTHFSQRRIICLHIKETSTKCEQKDVEEEKYKNLVKSLA